MNKTKTLIFASLSSVLILGGVIAALRYNDDVKTADVEIPANKYGAYLAAHHAIYTNDFKNADKYTKQLQDTELETVSNLIVLSEFLNGKMPENAGDLKDSKNMTEKFVFDAYLAKNNKWKELYNRHKNDKSALISPLRIWSGVSINYITKTLNFIDTLNTNESWKDFIRGQIYAELNRSEKAAGFFAKVDINFLNINDYLYLQSFYNHFDMAKKGDELKKEFIDKTSALYLLDLNYVPNWDEYSGKQNAMAFSLIQNISHTQIMMHSDLSLLMLRFAQVLQSDENSDAVKYYIGQYFYNNGGDFDSYLNGINPNSPFYPFAQIKIAEKNDNISDYKKILKSNDLFMPAIEKISAKYTVVGDKNSALDVLDDALSHPKLTEAGRQHLYRLRSDVNIAFKEYDDAQSDIDSASEVLGLNPDLLSNQIKVWAANHENIKEAYSHAIMLISKNPLQTRFWNSLGRVVWVNEGATEALDIIKSVTDATGKDSDLFETLGDIYKEQGENEKAAAAYMRAIELSDDGRTVLPELKKKLRKVK